MNILWFTWKDIDHPLAGGAERVQHEIASRLYRDGHRVIILTSQSKRASHKSVKHGYQIIRVGNRYSVYWKAMRYYRKQLRGWPDLAIEEVNTIPFFTRLYVKQQRRLFIHQLARQIWFHEFFAPLSWVGYAIEPLYIRFIAGPKVMTVSESSKNDLIKHGHKAKNISIISEGIDTKPIDLSEVSKYKKPTLLIMGSVRSMKQTHKGIMAFELAKQELPDLQLKIAGGLHGKYGKRIKKLVAASKHSKDISLLGRVSTKKKQQLMAKSHLLLATSIKEGWGLIVTEAASQGTPAVVFDVDGLRDSGSCIVKPNPTAMSQKVVELLNNRSSYTKLQRQAFKKATPMTFDQSYKDFCKINGIGTSTIIK